MDYVYFTTEHPILIEGDEITFRTGKRYEIKHAQIMGDIMASWYYFRRLNRPIVEFPNEVDAVGERRFSTLRELNYFLSVENERNNIKRIYLAEGKDRPKLPSTKECHQKCFELYEKHVQVQEFLSRFNIKVKKGSEA